MKKILSLVLVILLLGVSSLAEVASYSVVDLIPDTSQWGYSRTKFKEANGSGYQDIEIGGFKGLYLPDIAVGDYAMDGYYDFAEKQGNYYGLSRVVYLLDVSKKVSDANLTKCYKALVTDMSTADDPTSSSKTSSVWEYSDCRMEICIGKYTEFNGSKNKTVAVIFTAPTAEASASAGGTKGNAQSMQVKASATCGDYNHVGSDWSQEFYVNGEKVGKSTTVSIAAGDTITVSATITEEDKSPDIGTNSESYTVTQSDLKNGFSIRFKVDVRENKGRYSGSVATWNVTFNFS